MSIANEITRLTNAKAGIKTALEGKGVTVPANAKLDTYGSLVNSIESGVDTSDADATASDIVKNKTAYVNGVKVTGTLTPVNNLSVKSANSTVRNSSIDQRVYFDNLPLDTQLVNNLTSIRVGANWDNLANTIGLEANKIKTGVTILGIEGTVQEGITADKIIQAEDAELETIQEIVGDNDIGLSIISTPLTKSKLYEQGSIVEMHPTFEQLSNVLGLTASKLKAGETICGIDGTFTADANAVANDIVKNKTAYVNGAKVMGTLEPATQLSLKTANSTINSDNTEESLYFINTVGETQLVNNLTRILIRAQWSDIANVIGLTADKIKAGETILGITGTYAG